MGGDGKRPQLATYFPQSLKPDTPTPRNKMNTTSTAPFLLSRAAARPLSAPPAPRGHHSHLSQPDSLGTLAALATDPAQPRYVRRWHRAALEGSLAKLASAVLSVSSPR